MEMRETKHLNGGNHCLKAGVVTLQEGVSGLHLADSWRGFPVFSRFDVTHIKKNLLYKLVWEEK